MPEMLNSNDSGSNACNRLHMNRIVRPELRQHDKNR